MFDIHGIMKELAKRRPVFHSEADFQFALAWQTKENNPKSEIRLEYNPCPDAQHRRYLDIYVKSEKTVIELKYPTLWMRIDHDGEFFAPGLKGGGKNGRYRCVEDIARIEHTVNTRPNVDFGIFVLLTNRGDFWNESSRQSKDKAFHLHEKRRLEGRLLYPNNELAPIALTDSYDLNWCEYSDLKQGENTRFRYLAVEVGK